MLKVKIEQFGHSWVLRIDGELTTLNEMAEMAGVTPHSLKYMLNQRRRERVVREWILKKKAGVGKRSDTYYHNDMPMWRQCVTKICGVSPSLAARRLVEWQCHGDLDVLLKPIAVKAPMPKQPPKPVEVEPEKPPVSPPKHKPVEASVVVKPPERNAFVTSDDPDSDLSGLGDGKRDGNTRLTAIRGPSEYERNL